MDTRTAEPPRARARGSDVDAGPRHVPEESRDARQLNDFTNRITARARHFRKWPDRGTDCFRLYDQDIPDIPVILDRYGGRLRLVDVRGPRSGRTPEQHRRWLDAITDAAAHAAGLPASAVFILDRNLRPPPGAPAAAQAREHGVELTVDLRRGIELHKRAVRDLLGKASENRRIALIGGDSDTLTAIAAAGGASEITAASSIRDPALAPGRFETVLLDHARPGVDVLRLAWSLTNPRGGQLLVVTDPDAPDLTTEGLPGAPPPRLHDLTTRTQAEDMRTTPTHRSWRLAR